MKSASRLWIALSLTMLAGAIPAISNRALRVPLQRRSGIAGDPTLVQSATSKRYLGAKRVANMISYAHQCVSCSLAILFAQLPGKRSGSMRIPWRHTSGIRVRVIHLIRDRDPPRLVHLNVRAKEPLIFAIKGKICGTVPLRSERPLRTSQVRHRSLHLDRLPDFFTFDKWTSTRVALTWVSVLVLQPARLSLSFSFSCAQQRLPGLLRGA